jgi:biopolymer transport protein ExbB
MMPRNVVEETRQLLDQGKVDEAARRVEAERSFVGYVVHRGLRERDRGYEAMVKAMEDAADEATGARLRRVEHLNIIANIATMLGLLGTVLGLTSNFNTISQTVGAVDPRMLAGGIFQALITTVMGLIVGIPSLYFYGFFRNRIDAIITEATLAAEHMTEVFKDGRGARAAASAR